MISAIPTTTARTWNSVKAHYFLVGQLALALAVIAAIGAWQLSSGGGTASAPQNPVVSVSAPSFVTEAQPSPVYYLVSSEEQKDRLLSAIVAQVGDFQPLPDVHFVVVDSDDTLNQTVQMVVQQNDILYSNGLPEIKMVDLRVH